MLAGVFDYICPIQRHTLGLLAVCFNLYKKAVQCEKRQIFNSHIGQIICILSGVARLLFGLLE